MAASIAEQIRAAFQAALLANPQIVGIGDQVFRAREDLYSDRESTAINVVGGTSSARTMSTEIDDNEIEIMVEIFVRAVQDEVWETKADAIAVTAHAKIMAATMPGTVARISITDRSPLGDNGERTPGKETLKYAVRYLTSAFALDQAPH
jgi:hypothetical protein